MWTERGGGAYRGGRAGSEMPPPPPLGPAAPARHAWSRRVGWETPPPPTPPRCRDEAPPPAPPLLGSWRQTSCCGPRPSEPWGGSRPPSLEPSGAPPEAAARDPSWSETELHEARKKRRVTIKLNLTLIQPNKLVLRLISMCKNCLIV